MGKFIVCVGSLLIYKVGIAHPGHHHSLGSAEIHSLFSLEQLIWVVLLGILAVLFLRSR
jgi:hypothetical protein